jgi:hypothetical protein
MKKGLITLLVGATIAGASWAQLDLAVRLGADNIHSGPLLLSVMVVGAGSIIGGMIAVAGLIRLLAYAWRARKEPTE